MGDRPTPTAADHATAHDLIVRHAGNPEGGGIGDLGPHPHVLLEAIAQAIADARAEGYRAGWCERGEADVSLPIVARELAEAVERMRAALLAVAEQTVTVCGLAEDGQELWSTDRACFCLTAALPGQPHEAECDAVRAVLATFDALAEREATPPAGSDATEARVVVAVCAWLRDANAKWLSASTGWEEPQRVADALADDVEHGDWRRYLPATAGSPAKETT